MYGESVFTTMLMVDGAMRDWDLHFLRLKKGVEYIYGPFTDGSDWTLTFRNIAEERIQQIDGNKVVRLTIYREQARGLIKPQFLSIADLKIQLTVSSFDRSRTEDKMLKLRTCPVNKRPYWWPDYLKCGNYLETILSQKIYMRPGDDDILFLSTEDTVLESSVANIFVVRHNRLYTAPTGPNVLDGVMRKKVLSVGMDYFDRIEESETSMEQLLKADAIFGSNSVRGLFLVDQIDGYEINYTDHFQAKFKALKNRVFL